MYWHLYASPEDARKKLNAFRERYNEIRPHWALVPESGGDPVTAADVYARGVAVGLPAWQGWARAAKEKMDRLMHPDQQAESAA